MLNPANQRHPFSIGHVAKVTGIGVSTLRSWEVQGLLDPFKSSSGHRSYAATDVDRVRQIHHLQKVSGLSLAAIKQRFAEGEVEVDRNDTSAQAGQSIVDFGRIGARVRIIRKDAGLSLRELAKRTNIGLSHLSMFERGTAFLSPARLSAIATVFQSSLTELLGGTDGNNVPIIRNGKGRIVGSFGPGVLIEQLTVAEHLMDAEVWTIEVGRESDGFYSHEGEELIYVLDGSLEVTLAGRPSEVIHSGDCAYFSSRIDHRWRNAGQMPARVLWVNTDVGRLGSMQFHKKSDYLRRGDQGETQRQSR